MENIRIDGKQISPISASAYQELITIELNNADIDVIFPFKPETPRYSVSVNDVSWGYYKVLSKKGLANQHSTILSLHRQ